MICYTVFIYFVNIVLIVRTDDECSAILNTIDIEGLGVHALEMRECFADRLPSVVVLCTREVVHIAIVLEIDFELWRLELLHVLLIVLHGEILHMWVNLRVLQWFRCAFC